MDEAVRDGLFELATHMYVTPGSGVKLSVIEAIDRRLIEIKDTSFRTSYELEDSIRIRFVVDSFTGDIVPLNIALARKLIKIDTKSATMLGENEVLTLGQAYTAGLAFTEYDLDGRGRAELGLRVHLVRKSNNGRVMSLKSALVKGWISPERHVYVDKMARHKITGGGYEEFRFSQAVDMDLLILRVDAKEQRNNKHVLAKEQPNKAKINQTGSRNVLARSRSNNFL